MPLLKVTPNIFIDDSSRVREILRAQANDRFVRSKKSFRTINVQWIGQWGLFSRCSSSENQ
jgi:hypothetical protein